VRAKFNIPNTHWRTGFRLGCSQGCRTVLDSENREKATYGRAEINTGGYYGNHGISLGVGAVDLGYQVTSSQSERNRDGVLISSVVVRERTIYPAVNFDYSLYFTDSNLAYTGFSDFIVYAGYTWNFKYIRVGFILILSLVPILPYFAFRKD
jgi:hypothetical protein